jgi:outer membrane immunogenic protein
MSYVECTELRSFMKKALCASAATLAWLLASALLAPGLATDLGVAPMYQAPPSPVTNWAGSYFGVSGGGAWGSAVVRNDVMGLDQVPGLDSAAMSGASAGFNLQNGSLVLGYESDTAISGKQRNSFEFPGGTAFKDDIKERWLSTFRGRVGYAQDNWLLYATAGGALANLGNSVLGADIAQRHWHWGVAAGAGLEVRLTSDWSAKVEYLYVGLQDKSYLSPALNGAFSSNQRVNLDDHILRFGVNYRLPWSVLDTFFSR